MFHIRMQLLQNLKKRKDLEPKNRLFSKLKVVQLSKKVIKVIPMPQSVTDINLSTTISREIIKRRTSATTV